MSSEFIVTAASCFPRLVFTISLYQHNMNRGYRPQTKFAKVMFLQVSVCPQEGGRVRALGVLSWGGAWWRTPPPGRLLFRAVRILLECILVGNICTEIYIINAHCTPRVILGKIV